MLSVRESAQQLGVSQARVRALIKSGRLPAVKNGREWVLREEDVLQRIADSPRAGRPKADTTVSARKGAADTSHSAVSGEMSARAHELYSECRRIFGCLPATELLEAAQSREEASFYMAVFDFFLQQRQRELIRKGVF